MKKFKTLSFAFGVALLLLAAGPLRPAFAGAVSFNDNKQVVCSTSAVTALSSQCSTCLRTTIINGNTDYILIGTSSALVDYSTVASTGTARITNASYSPDGVVNPYTGPLYCLGSGSGGVTVQVLRVK